MPNNYMQNAKQKRKSPEGVSTNELVMSCYNGTNDEIFPHVLSLYVEHGSVVADVTYGKGVFWRGVPSGLYDLRPTDIETGNTGRND